MMMGLIFRNHWIAQLKLSELERGKVKDVWLKTVKVLEIHRDNKDRGNVHLELLYFPHGKGNGFTNRFTFDLPMTHLEKVITDGSGSKNSDVINKQRSVDTYVVLTVKKTGTKNMTEVGLYI